MIGTTISHYRILEKLGEGGMGVVYKAQDTKLDRIVALKFLPHHLTSSEAEQSRLLQEAKAAAALNHPNVCSVIDIQEADGPAYAGAPAGKQQFIVMEYVDGVTLREKVVRRSESTLPLQMNEAISYAIQIGEALQAAHTKGIIHRDIKSENIMVTSDARIKVMDFGLAKLKGSLKLTRTLSTSGTLAYMAPEQIQGGAVDARSDIFSFGVVLFEMLTGRLPFRGEHETAMMYSILNEEPETIGKYIPDAPSELLHIVNRALEKDQEDRYQSVHDMVIDLRRSKKESSRPSRQVSHHQASGAGAPSPLVSGKRWRTNRFVVRVGIPLTVIVIGAAWLIIQQSARAPFDSIAVLPLANTAADPNIEYLSDGITEQIINTLTRIPGLRVVPRSSVFYYKGKDKSPLDIGRELDVRAVLLGRIIKRGDTLNIQTDLLDVQQESQLWGEQYVRKLTDVAGVQAEIARGISKKLQLRWSDDEGGELSRRSTENDIAYQSYLKGRYYWNKRSDDGMQKSIQHFEQAIENDPAFALAYV
ncbi:MAG: serine/threonine-protein kinase, partial [Bacteroidota bacterium]